MRPVRCEQAEAWCPACDHDPNGDVMQPSTSGATEASDGLTEQLAKMPNVVARGIGPRWRHSIAAGDRRDDRLRVSGL